MSLRSGRRPAQSDTMSSPSQTPPTRSQTSRLTPYLLLVYPLVLAIGSLYSAVSPVAATHQHAAPLDPGITSAHNTPSIPEPANYFAGKRNLVNLYFVKIGWFWTTLAFLLVQLTTHPTRPSRAKRPYHYIQAALRYALATLSWIFVTQWFFGPGLIDRSFQITGGHCEVTPSEINTTAAEINELPNLLSAVACKAAGGTWRGGYDISGHVFILVLSSSFLLYELFLADRHSSHPSVTPQAAAKIAQTTTEEEKEAVGGWENQYVAKFRIWSRYFVYAVVALDFWMLLMTAIWFHTWQEKLSGLMLAGGSVWSTYFLGDFLPVWRNIFGGA